MNATSSAATPSSAPPRQASRWQDVRARAIDATFDADRRRVGERVALVFRWLFLIVLGALNHLNPNTTTEAKVVVDVVLFGWAVMNVTVQVVLVRGYRPGKQFSLTTMVLDIFFAAGLVYLSDGFSSPFFLALFLAVITNAVRFGATASFVSALVVSFLYLFIGGSFTPSNFSINADATIGQMFLFLVVALATGYMTRELERERRAAVARAAQADSAARAEHEPGQRHRHKGRLRRPRRPRRADDQRPARSGGGLVARRLLGGGGGQPRRQGDDAGGRGPRRAPDVTGRRHRGGRLLVRPHGCGRADRVRRRSDGAGPAQPGRGGVHQSGPLRRQRPDRQLRRPGRQRPALPPQPPGGHDGRPDRARQRPRVPAPP